jgi:O-antigen/teichoic acid export membrane protein
MLGAGGAITLLAQGGKLALQMISMTVLARLLTPADYGLVGMVTVVTGFVALFNDLGLSTATIQKAQINHQQISTLFWVNVTAGVLIALVVAALAPVVAWFYAEPRLTILMGISAGLFLLAGFTVQHQALLRRQMRLGALAIIEILSLLFGALAAVLAALLGAGYWSLIVMSFAGTMGGILGVWWACRWWPGLPARRSGVRRMLGFGANLTGFHVLNYFARNLDNVLIGKVWGAEALGFYAKAHGLLMLPLTQITGPVAAAAILTLSRVAEEPARYRTYYLKCLSLITLVTMPLAVFLMVMSSEVIYVVLGPQWSEAARIFMFLGIAALWQPIAHSTGWLLVSQGRAADMLRWGVVASGVTVGGIVLGLPWGTTGVAAFHALFNAATLPILFWFVGRKGPVRAWDICQAVAAPLYLSFGVLVVLVAVRSLCAGLAAPLTLTCASTATVFVVATLLLVIPGGRQLRADIWDVSRIVLARR